MNPMQMKTAEERKEIARKGRETRANNRYTLAMARKAELAYKDELKQEILELESKLRLAQRTVALAEISAGLTGKTLLREDEIIKAAAPLQGASGVYFLVKEKKIIYVGQSVNVYSRVRDHSHMGHDSYAFVPCSVDLLNKIESLYIHLLQPPMNGHRYDGTKAAPLRLEELLTM